MTLRFENPPFLIPLEFTYNSAYESPYQVLENSVEPFLRSYFHVVNLALPLYNLPSKNTNFERAPQN